MILPILTGSGIFNSEIMGFKKNTFSSERTVEEYEIEFYTNSDTYGFCCGEIVPYTDGVLAVYRPGDVRCSCLNFRCKYLHIIVRDAELSAMLNGLPRFIRLQNTERASSLFDKIDLLFPLKGDAASLRFTAYLLSLIADIEDENSFHNGDSKDGKISDAVATAKAYIEKYYQNPLSLEDIAGVVHLTPNHFCTLFTSVCGLSPHSYLTSVRIDRAKYLLRSTTMNITEIAMHVGISSYNYFSYVFRREMHMTPTAYRNEITKNKYYL